MNHNCNMNHLCINSC